MAASRFGLVCCSRLTSHSCVMGAYHRPLVVPLLPFIITLPLDCTSTCNPHYLEFTSQLALHSCTIDNTECLIPGNTCAYLAFIGNSGTPMNSSCVLLTFSAFTTVTTMGFAVIILLVRVRPPAGNGYFLRYQVLPIHGCSPNLCQSLMVQF